MCVSFQNENTLIMTCQKTQKVNKFDFDHVFSNQTTQDEIFTIIAEPILNSAFEGFNGTIFAYGQTSSGKTWTMEGIPKPANQRGIIPRSIDWIFEKISNSNDLEQYDLRVSMLEIYNEEVRDLFVEKSQNLNIRGTPATGFYVANLTTISVNSPEEMKESFTVGTKNRSVGATNMNEHSSRSHSVFIIEMKRKLADGKQLSSKMYLVDLAGSENAGRTGAEGGRLQEGANINKSLSTLGSVIRCLTQEKGQLPPFRDSKLTMILHNAIGGNSKTALILNCSPAQINIEDTLSTLRFGQLAKKIKNKVTANVEASSSELLKQLNSALAQIQSLKAQLDAKGKIAKGGNIVSSDNNEYQKLVAEKANLLTEVNTLKAEIDELTISLNEEREQSTKREEIMHNKDNIINDLKKAICEKDAMILSLKEGHTKEIERLNADTNEQIELLNKSHNDKVQEIQKELDDIKEKSFNDNNKHNEEIMKYQNIIQELQQKISSLEQEKMFIQTDLQGKIINMEGQLEASESYNKRLEEVQSNLRNQVQESKTTIELLNRKLDSMNDLKAMLLNQVVGNKTNNNNNDNNGSCGSSSSNNNVEMSPAIRAAMEETMKKNMDEMTKKLYEEHMSEINSLKEQIEKINEEKLYIETDLRGQLRNLENQLKASQDYVKKLNAMQNEILEREKEYQNTIHMLNNKLLVMTDIEAVITSQAANPEHNTFDKKLPENANIIIEEIVMKNIDKISKERLDNQKEEIMVLKNDLEKLTNANIEKIFELNGEIESLKSQLKVSEDYVKKLTNNQNELNEHIHGYEKEINELKSKLETMKQVENIIKNQASDGSGSVNAGGGGGAGLSSAVQELMEEAIKKNLDEISAKRSEEQLQEINNLNSKLSNLEQENESMRVNLESKIQNLNKQLEERQERLKEMSNKQSELNNKIKEKEDTIEELKRKLEGMNELDKLLNNNNGNNNENTNENISIKNPIIEKLINETVNKNLDELTNKKIKDLELEIQNLKENNNRLEQDKQYIETDMQGQLSNLQGQLSAAQDYNKKITEMNTKQAEHAKELQATIQMLNEKLSNMNELESLLNNQILPPPSSIGSGDSNGSGSGGSIPPTRRERRSSTLDDSETMKRLDDTYKRLNEEQDKNMRLEHEKQIIENKLASTQKNLLAVGEMYNTVVSQHAVEYNKFKEELTAFYKKQNEQIIESNKQLIEERNEYAKKNTEYTNVISSLQTRIESMTKQLATFGSENNQLKNQINQLQSQVQNSRSSNEYRSKMNRNVIRPNRPTTSTTSNIFSHIKETVAFTLKHKAAVPQVSRSESDFIENVSVAAKDIYDLIDFINKSNDSIKQHIENNMAVITLTENLGIRNNELEEMMRKMNEAMGISNKCANECNPIITSLSNKARCYEQLVELGKNYLKQEAEFNHYSQKLSELKMKNADPNKLYSNQSKYTLAKDQFDRIRVKYEDWKAYHIHATKTIFLNECYDLIDKQLDFVGKYFEILQSINKPNNITGFEDYVVPVPSDNYQNTSVYQQPLNLSGTLQGVTLPPPPPQQQMQQTRTMRSGTPTRGLPQPPPPPLPQQQQMNGTMRSTTPTRAPPPPPPMRTLRPTSMTMATPIPAPPQFINQQRTMAPPPPPPLNRTLQPPTQSQQPMYQTQIPQQQQQQPIYQTLQPQQQQQQAQGLYTVVAQFPYQGTQKSDLSFNKGDRIVIFKEVSKEWLYGGLNGKVGIFPSNFVQRI